MSKRVFHIQVMLHDLMPGWVVGGIPATTVTLVNRTAALSISCYFPGSSEGLILILHRLHLSEISVNV